LSEWNREAAVEDEVFESHCVFAGVVHDNAVYRFIVKMHGRHSYDRFGRQGFADALKCAEFISLTGNRE